MATNEHFIQEIQRVVEACKEIPQDKLLFRYNGILYPSALCSPENFKALESFDSREDDMLLVSYPKCGTNWTFQLLNDIVRAVYNKEPPKMIPILEFGNPNKYEKLKEESSPRVMATHLYYDNIPKSFLNKKIKMLVVFRNPKDAAVSSFNFYNNNPILPNYSSWDVFFQDFISGNVGYGSYFDHAVAWNKHIDDEGVFIMTFEKMKEDLNAAVKEISEFFGFSLTEDQVTQIASKGTFESMKQNSKQTHGEIGKSIFRKGEVGDWKNHFSEAQSQEVDAKFEETLAGTKLGEMLKYNDYC